MSLPDVYLIGAPKAGSTSLARWLDEHPDVFVSTPKEPAYWASDFPEMRRHHGFETQADYEALYTGPRAAIARRLVDASTVYLYSATAAQDIMTAAPHALFVVALRDPVDLVVSYHRSQLVVLSEDEPDFEVAWARSLRAELPSSGGFLDSKLLDYQMIGGLGAAVDRLLAVVPRERVHFVRFAELADHPQQVWSRLTDFLGVSSPFVPAFSIHNASNKMYRWKKLRHVTQRPPAALNAPVRTLRQWTRTTQNPTVAAAKRLMWRPEPRPSITPTMRATVADYFASDVVLLEKLLARGADRSLDT